MEEGKDCTVQSKTSQSRVLTLRLLVLLLLFLVLSFAFSMVSIFMIKQFRISSVAAIVKPNIVPCIEEKNDLDRWIKRPSNLIHTMSDRELLWRASFMPRVKIYPFTRVPKLAFMFLTKGPLPLAPLWERFFKGHERLYSIYIHSIPSYQADFPTSSVFYGRHIPSQVTEWGKMSLCDAERRLLANALLDISNEWFVLVSESCIPLYDFNVIYNHILKSKYSFIGAYDDPGPHGRGRYNESMAPEVNVDQWRKGSQWFEINRKLALLIVEDTTYYPKFAKFCKPPCYVDEHYFPTLLNIQAENLLANRSITWTDWSRGGAHPATFGKRDITEQFFERVFQGNSCLYNGRPSSVCYLFARKFAPSALEPLLLLAPKFLGY